MEQPHSLADILHLAAPATQMKRPSSNYLALCGSTWDLALLFATCCHVKYLAYLIYMYWDDLAYLSACEYVREKGA